MKYYFVYVKDSLFQKYWQVHVEAETRSLTDIFSYATMKTLGGSAFGIKEFLDQKPENFEHGLVEPMVL